MQYPIRKGILALIGVCAIFVFALVWALRSQKPEERIGLLMNQGRVQQSSTNEPQEEHSAAPQPTSGGEGISAPAPARAPEQIMLVNFQIDDGDSTLTIPKLILPNSASVLAALEEATAQKKLTFEVDRSSSLGAFIKQIGEKKNGTGAKYWQYWVNGKQPLIAADRLQLKPGDTVLWAFRRSEM